MSFDVRHAERFAFDYLIHPRSHITGGNDLALAGAKVGAISLCA